MYLTGTEMDSISSRVVIDMAQPTSRLLETVVTEVIADRITSQNLSWVDSDRETSQPI